MHEALTTTEGSAVEVLSQGRYNRDAGPDFLNAQIVIDGIRWGGDVEIHLRASDWHLHGHDTDPAYNAVILHVVATYDADAITSQGRKLTTVVFPHLALYQQHQEALCTSLTKPPCGHRLAQLPAIDRASWLARLLVERLETRTKLIQNERKKCALDWEEAFYRSIARSLGQKVNSDPMERLAAHTPLKELYKICDSLQALEAILHGQSELLGQADALMITHKLYAPNMPIMRRNISYRHLHRSAGNSSACVLQAFPPSASRNWHRYFNTANNSSHAC